MKRILLFSLLCFCTQAFAFDGAKAKALSDILGSDDFAGRRGGFPGGRKAEDFLANQFKSYGIEFGGDKGYFQEVPLFLTEEKRAEMTMMDHELGKIPFVEGIDFTLITHSGSGSFSAPVVIVGSGYVRPDKDRDDYGSVDVNRKIVLIIREKPDSPYDFSEDNARSKTLAWAKEKGALAVMWYQGARPVNGAAIPESSYDPYMPMFYVGDRVLSALLDNNGYSPDTYKKKMKSAPLPLETGRTLFVDVQVKKVNNKSPHNVLGMLYGNDPVLKNEVIVVGGHMDHIGPNAKGIIYNGADDNGSGTAVVSELARSLAENRDGLKRSILFMHFCGEEEGLLGSDYFIEHPIIPLNNIACMLNFDMSGQGTGDVSISGGDILGGIWSDYKNSLTDDERAHTKFSREDGYGASDNLSFILGGVPAIAFWTPGDHPFYHRYDDDPQWISETVLQNVGTRAEQFIRYLAAVPSRMGGRADTTRMLTKFTETIDFNGFDLDAKGTIPANVSVSAAWIADNTNSINDIVSRIAEFHYNGNSQKISTDGLRQAVQANRKQERGMFIGISENGLGSRKPSDARTLIKQGVSVLKLSAGKTAPSGAKQIVMDSLRKGGVYALIPLDFSAPTRVETWKNQSIVHGTLGEFSALSAAIQEGLLKSDAMVVLEVSETPQKEQLDALRIARVRRLHLNFASVDKDQRELQMLNAVKALYAAGWNRDEIIAITGGNLRRYIG